MNITRALIIAYDAERWPVYSAISKGTDRDIEAWCRAWLATIDNAHLVIAYQVDDTTFTEWDARQVAHAGLPWMD